MGGKEGWEYPTIIDAIVNLRERGMEDKDRYLVIGVAVVLGARRACEEYREKRPTTSQIKEAGMIAEEIGNLAVDPEALGEGLEWILGMKKEDASKSTIYGIINEIRPYNEEGVRKMGKQLEGIFGGRGREEEKVKDQKEKSKEMLKERTGVWGYLIDLKKKIRW